MKTKFNGILTLLLALVVQIAFAQSKTISGSVSDESGPLPGVSIMIKGTLDNQIIAFMFCKFIENNKKIHINSIAVHHLFRNKGYGTAMIDYLKRYNCDLTLNVSQNNLKGIHFYKENSFKIKSVIKDYYNHFKNNNAYLFEYIKT